LTSSFCNSFSAIAAGYYDSEDEEIESILSSTALEFAERLDEIEIIDASESAFALLYLIDSGSLLPWVYPLGVNIAKAITYSTPQPDDLYFENI